MVKLLGCMLMVCLALAAFCCEDTAGRGRDGDDDGSSDGDSDGDGDSDTDSDVDADGDSDSDCEEELELIYVVDLDNMFYSFDPLAAPADAFQQVGSGPLTCASGGQPFSMSVGRDGYAYVLFVEGGMFGYSCVAVNKVDIHTGACEEATPFSCDTAGFNTFGMGYVTDSESTNDETLYIGNQDSPGNLGTLDVSNGDVITVGPMTLSGPEFTGNALGELWGFFPQATTPTVAQIDKEDATVVEDQYWQLSELTNDAHAWAFAFWGGSFYVFYKTAEDSSTNVYKLTDGTLTTHISNSGKLIVGAGVSTCAPVVIE